MTEDATLPKEAETAETEVQEPQPIAAIPKKRTRKPKTTAKNTKPAPATPGSAPQTEPDRPHKPVPEQFITDLVLLADTLQANPGVLDPVREVFEYHLVDPIDRKTFPRMVNAMSMLLGPSATMVIMTACHVNSAVFFEDLLYAVQKHPTAEKIRGAVWTIQHLTSIYGNRVQEAYTLSSGTMDDDWHTVDVNTFKREGDNPYWTVDVQMMLYSGKECHVRMTPDSIFQLVEILAAELGKNIPVENVDTGLIKKCEENLKIFHEKFYGAKKCEETEKPGDEDEHPPGYA